MALFANTQHHVIHCPICIARIPEAARASSKTRVESCKYDVPMSSP